MAGPTLMVRRREEKVVERIRGYLPTEKTVVYQDLVRVTPGFFGESVDVLDTEVVPEHALISLGCFGDTGGWVSKWSELVGAQKAAARAQSGISV